MQPPGLTNQAWCEQHNISLKSYYYWIAKIRKLALEDLPRKNNGIHASADQNTLLPNPASEFAEIPLPGRHAARSDPAVVLHIGTIVNNGELVPSARSNCTTLPKQEYHLAGWLYRSATVLCQRCEPLFR